MRIFLHSLLFLFLLCFPLSIFATPQKENTSFAILTEDSESEIFSYKIAKTFSENGFTLQQEALTKAVIKTLDFPNKTNLSTKEARNLGQALGVETFLVIKSKLLERAEVGASLYGEGYLALNFVNSKNGNLILFDFIEAKETTLDLTKEALIKELKSKIPNYTKQVSKILDDQLNPVQLDQQDIEAIELPSENSSLAKDFDLPEFTSRKQPVYTENARKMAVSAIVELEIVLRKDGKVGNIEVTRWAGFGLDESAIAAAKELKFKPALLEKNPINCRALIRYNFNVKIQR
jgi:TonB family protein